ncbi:MAG TPA: gephyrin-like molybdotransferase Glp [Flavobacteriales bacterium]
MIGVEEARQRLVEAAPAAQGVQQPLLDADGRYLTGDVIAPYDDPLFDRSAVDGYAFRFADIDQALRINGAIAAGEVYRGGSLEGCCVRIFTGAPVPPEADTVVMQEFCGLQDERVTINDPKLQRGGNIRRQGEQVRAGDVLLKKGTRITPAAVGLLASVGVREVEVGRSPAVAIVRTGNEFVEHGAIRPGLIFSSNDDLLVSGLRQAGLLDTSLHKANDSVGDITEAVENALQEAEVVITTGGVSVGDHDLVPEVLKRLGARILFHGVAQKPGKPMLLAEVQGRYVFGLPGNPRAVFVLFHTYVLPFLRMLQGATDPWPRKDTLPIEQPLRVKGDRAEFRAARVHEGRIELLADEGSHMLRTLVVADALAYIPPTVRELRAGDPVELLYLPR